MLINTSILLIVMAGFMNGSFVIPAKYIKNATNEATWFYHSIMGFMIIPWMLLGLTQPHTFHYALLSLPLVAWLVLGGAIFGMGQVCFAYAIASIGTALSFAINLGIGVVIGSLFVIFFQNDFFTSQGGLVVLSVFLILCSLAIYYYAGRQPNQLKLGKHHGADYSRGWVLACFAGVTSGFQNIIFVTAVFYTRFEFQVSNSFWVWPPFLLAAAIPMLIGFSFKIKNKSGNCVQTIGQQLTLKNTAWILLMGSCYSGSLALYSIGMSQLSPQQQIICWPIFMVSIILTSQFWGWLYGESKNMHQVYKLLGTACLIVAIFILSYQ